MVVDDEKVDCDEDAVPDDVGVGLTLLDDIRLRDENEVVVLGVDEVEVEVLAVDNNEPVVVDEEELFGDKEFVADSDEADAVLLDDR